MNKVGRREVASTLDRVMDAKMESLGFTREKSATCYIRRIDDSIQSLNILIEPERRSGPGMMALYPSIAIKLPRVNAILASVYDERGPLPAGVLETVVVAPFNFLAPKDVRTHWVFSDEVSLANEVSLILKVFLRYGVDLVNRITTDTSIVDAFQDPSYSLKTLEYWPVVAAAANLSLGRAETAYEIVATAYEAPGLARTYASIIEYFEDKADEVGITEAKT